MVKDISTLVMYQDEALLVINKPAGLPVLPDGYDPQAEYLVGVLKAHFGPVWVVHRLDRQTSGVLLFARQAEAHRNLNRQFESHSVKKVYLALVVGNPSWEERTIRLSLRPDGDRQHRTVVDPRHGQRAVTHLRVLERFGRFTWMQAIPETGRTHQIRAHLAAVGLPIAVDALYGNGNPIYLSSIKPHYRQTDERDERPLLARLGLHAHSLSFTHPQSGEPVYFEAPLPKDLATVLRQLRRITS